MNEIQISYTGIFDADANVWWINELAAFQSLEPQFRQIGRMNWE